MTLTVSDYSLQRVRLGAWLTLLAAAALQNYFSRGIFASDIVSYMDLARHATEYYPLGVSTYWSPLYPALLRLGMLTPLSAVTLFRSLNVLTIAFFLWSYERFMFAVRVRLQLESGLVMMLAGYSILLMVAAGSTLSTVGGPDVLTAGVYCLIAAAVLRTSKDWRTRLLIGFLCGLAYFSKTAMFPICVMFLAVLWWRDRSGGISGSWIAPVVFGALSLFVIVPVSATVGHPSIGEAGTLNAKWTFGGLDHQTSGRKDSAAAHPLQYTVVSGNPGLSCFGDRYADVTYPLWFDPPWWYKDSAFKLSISKFTRHIVENLGTYAVWFGTYLAPVPVLALWVFLRRPKKMIRVDGTCVSLWMLSLGCLLLFLPIHAELRYVAGALAVMITLTAYMCLKAIATAEGRMMAAVVLACSALLVAGLRVYRIYANSGASSETSVSIAALALGLHSGERVLAVGDGMSGGYFLAGLHVCCEMGVSTFQGLTDNGRRQTLNIARLHGATSAVMFPAVDQMPGWKCRPEARVCGLTLAEKQ